METLREHFEAECAAKLIQHIIKNMPAEGILDEHYVYTGIEP